jgi:thiol-disulfide isomerase/thioredoxin
MPVIKEPITTRGQFIALITDAPRIFPGCEHVLIRFTAEWCGPCKKIAPLVAQYVPSLAPNVWYVDVNIDRSHDIYSFLKSKRVIGGVPTIFCYSFPRPDTTRHTVHLPTRSAVGSDPTKIREFFDSYVGSHIG